MTLMAFTSGLDMLRLGILNQYLWCALDETRSRTPFVINRHWRADQEGIPKESLSFQSVSQVDEQAFR